jgi:hypothetical protein
MRLTLVAFMLISVWLSGCSVYDSVVVECENYPLKQTQKLIVSNDFEYLKYKKISVFNPLINNAQIFLADSKFDFSTSYVLYLDYFQDSQGLNRQTDGCVSSSSLSLRYPFNEYQARIVSSYIKFLMANGMHKTHSLELQDAIRGEVAYTQHGKLSGHRFFYGVSDHPVRGKFFKIDLKE